MPPSAFQGRTAASACMSVVAARSANVHVTCQIAKWCLPGSPSRPITGRRRRAAPVPGSPGNSPEKNGAIGPRSGARQLHNGGRGFINYGHACMPNRRGSVPVQTCIVTCMRNEGPFILEWIAHHRAIGVRSFLIFTNDCDDGSAELLDTLDDLGIVRHLENPDRLLKSSKRQLVAFDYATWLKEYRRADYVALIDADEFINVRLGDGTLAALFAATGTPDVLSLNQIHFDFSGVRAFADTPLTDQFFHTNGEEAGAIPTKRTGLKSLHRVRPEIEPLNHVPQLDPRFAGTANWVDGSGRPVPVPRRLARKKVRRADTSRDFAQINHYVLRSVESFMVKHDRGSGVGQDRFDALSYAERYSLNPAPTEDRSILTTQAKRQAELAALMAEPAIARAHAACVEGHRARIAALRQTPEGQTLYRALARIAERHRHPAPERTA